MRLVPRRKKKGVQWTDETVDNEHAGGKTSKKCCVFHRRRQFGDWSDDDDSGDEGAKKGPCDQGKEGGDVDGGGQQDGALAAAQRGEA